MSHSLLAHFVELYDNLVSFNVSVGLMAPYS